MSSLPADPRRSGVKAFLTSDLGEVGPDGMIRGTPGGMIPVTNEQGTVVGFNVACPSCGVWGGICFVTYEGFTRPWRVAGGSVDDVSTLSVMNSILKHCCGWHGYLTNGVFETVPPR